MSKWLALAVASLVASGAFAQQEQPGAEDFLACQDAVKNNDFDAVITSCEAALAANSDLFASNYYLGFAYRSKKDWEQCASNFETFLQKLGSNAEAKEMIEHATREGGLCYARGNSPTKAIPLLQKAVGSKPNDKEAQFFLGVTLMRANRDGEAEQAFSKVIQLDPSLARAYYYAGRVNFNRQEWDTASQRLNKFLELAPEDTFAADAHFMAGSMAVRMAEGSDDGPAQQSAVEHLERFLAAKPTAPQAPQAHYILGSIAAQREDDDTAKTHFERYLELAPQGDQAEEVRAFLQDLSETSS